MALVDFFKSEGTDLGGVHTSPPEGSDRRFEDYRTEWQDYARDAGLTLTSDINNVARYMTEIVGSAGVARVGGHGALTDTLNAVQAAGLTVNDTQRSAIASAVLRADAGATRSQCHSPSFIMLLYLGRSGSGEELEWLVGQLQQAERADTDRAGEASVATVDIKSMPGYSTHHRKTTSMSLERALNSPRPELWNHYKLQTLEKAGAAGLHKAAQRFMKFTIDKR